MKEDFVQSVWKFQLFNQKEFNSESGQFIRIVHPGYEHQNAGPDFISAKIYIDEILWVGNVEIHVNSQEWYAHKHHLDAAYNNVILHVVFNSDGKPCFTQNGLLLNTLVLEPYIDNSVLNNYEHLAEDLRVLPCVTWWNAIEPSIVEHWLARMCVSRLESKAQELSSRLHTLNRHWDQLFFEILARQMGFHVNSDPMERLARSIKTEWIQKMCDQELSVDALFFGQAGMLNRTFKDDYPNQLKEEYQFLTKKYNLQSIEASTWKFSKLRPLNFPTIRIAQLSAIVQHHPKFFTECIELNEPTSILNYFDVEINAYWDTHYTFDSESASRKKYIGKESINQLILNTLCITWVLYANVTNSPEYAQKAMNLMEMMTLENNRYVTMFNDVSYEFKNSVHSQGLRYLWEYYCNDKKCLNCSIGIQGLKLK